MHLHCAQVPPPPQADDKNTPLADRVCSSLPPAATVNFRSAASLISMVTSPLLTSLARAAKITATNKKTIAVNRTTPNSISVVISYFPSAFTVIHQKKT